MYQKDELYVFLGLQLKIIYIKKKKPNQDCGFKNCCEGREHTVHIIMFMHTYIFDMDRQSYFLLHRSIIVFQFLSCLASADPCFNSVRSEIYGPL